MRLPICLGHIDGAGTRLLRAEVAPTSVSKLVSLAHLGVHNRNHRLYMVDVPSVDFTNAGSHNLPSTGGVSDRGVVGCQ